MSRLKQILLATAMMAAAASDDRVYKQSNEFRRDALQS